MSTSVIVFAGPSLHSRSASALIPDGVEIRPPARRNDVAALLTSEPGCIALIDGRFHQSLAVGHAELRAALQAGWRVWGLASMGAIRAFEMRDVGMQGFGWIYEHFLGHDDFQDDEVALLHSPMKPFVPVSEPLIHLRYFVRAAETKWHIERGRTHRVIHDLKGMWYGDRTIEQTAALLEQHCGIPIAAVTQLWRERCDEFRIKNADLDRFFEARPWLHPEGCQTAPRELPFAQVA